MSALSQTSTILRSRPGSDPVFGPFGGLLRTTLHNVRLQWFLYRTERRKARAPEPLGEMNAHMLRDIGAPDAMVARAAASKPLYERTGIPFGFTVLLASLVLSGAPTPSSAASVTSIDREVPAEVRVVEAPMAGVFAGEYVKGAPVYRFPAVVVTGSRKESPTGSLQPCRQMRAVSLKTPA